MKCRAAGGCEVPDVICAARQFVLEARKLGAPRDASENPVACAGCAAGKAVLWEVLSGGRRPVGEHEITVDFSEAPEVLQRFLQVARESREAPDAHLRWLVGVYVNH